MSPIALSSASNSALVSRTMCIFVRALHVERNLYQYGNILNFSADTIPEMSVSMPTQIYDSVKKKKKV